MDSRKVYTGREIINMFGNIQNDVFGDDNHLFVLLTVNKEFLYDKVCVDKRSYNLKTYEEWQNDADNYDNYHTDTINSMINYIRDGGKLPPLIVDKDYGLYDGQHRLTAYSMMDEIQNIEIFKEI